MIVRIATERQYELPDEDADKLNDLDNEAVAAVEAGDEERWHGDLRVDARARAQRRQAGRRRRARGVRRDPPAAGH